MALQLLDQVHRGEIALSYLFDGFEHFMEPTLIYDVLKYLFPLRLIIVTKFNYESSLLIIEFDLLFFYAETYLKYHGDVIVFKDNHLAVNLGWNLFFIQWVNYF